MCQARVSEASRNAFPSVGFLRPSVMCENRGMNVLACLVCYIFLDIGLGRIGSMFSGMSVNYK